jgi:hypothetical protein
MMSSDKGSTMIASNALWDTLNELFDSRRPEGGLAVKLPDGSWKNAVWVKLKTADELAEAMYWGNPRNWSRPGGRDSSWKLDRELSFPLDRVARDGGVDGFFAAYTSGSQPLVIVAVRDGRACYETVCGGKCDPEFARHLLGEVIGYLEANLDFFTAPRIH